MSEHRKIKVIKKVDKPPPDADDDLRRLVISMANVLKRRFPKDYQRIMAEMNEPAVGVIQ
jgi:hypothetical protein